MSNRIESLALVVLGVPVLAFGLAATTAHADTIYVCWDGSGDYLTIQEGIDAAQDGDEVVVCDGVYTGAANKNLDFGGKRITVRSANGPDNCIIDCEGSGRGFYFHSGETNASIVDGFEIRNGNVGSPGGGAIYCEYSSPMVRNCSMIGNATSSRGGAVSARNSSAIIARCVISGNTALVDGGGGVYCFAHADLTIAECRITGNTAGYRGGGIFCYGLNQPTITHCTISGNNTSGGWDATSTGGGVQCSESSNATIMNCVISSNAAWPAEWGCKGGGIDCVGSNPSIINCLIFGNFAEEGWGGGLSLRANSDGVQIVNCTFTDNYASYGGGAIDDYSSDFTATNCILWGNGHCEISVRSASAIVTYSDVKGGWDGEGNIDADPQFVAGGLSAGSPCIDAGDNEAVPDGVTEDFDGNPRFVDDPCTEPDTGNGDPPIVDMGAYEYQPCAGDVDCDGDTDHSDLGELLSGWCSHDGDPNWNPNADLDGDGHVGHGDLGILLADWGCGT